MITAIKCGSRYDSPREDDDCYCVCTKQLGHTGRHRCCCDERWETDQLSLDLDIERDDSTKGGSSEQVISDDGERMM